MFVGHWVSPWLPAAVDRPVAPLPLRFDNPSSIGQYPSRVSDFGSKTGIIYILLAYCQHITKANHGWRKRLASTTVRVPDTSSFEISVSAIWAKHSASSLWTEKVYSRISFVEKAFHPKYSFWESPHPLLLDTPDAFCLLFTYYLHISHIICLLVKYYTDIKCRLQKLKNILDAYCILKSSGIERAPPCGRAFCVLQYFCYDWLDVKLHPMVATAAWSLTLCRHAETRCRVSFLQRKYLNRLLFRLTVVAKALVFSILF